MIQEIHLEKQINDFKGLSEHFQNTAQWFGFGFFFLFLELQLHLFYNS